VNCHLRPLRLLSLCSLALPATAAVPVWLIATPDENVRAGAPIMLDVVKPTTQIEWPGQLGLRLRGDDSPQELTLIPVGTVAPDDMRRTYRGVLPVQLSKLLRVDLAGIDSNRLALVVSAPDVIEQMRTATSHTTHPNIAGDQLFPINEPVLSANEPMYFVVGGHRGLSARFQLSFKYRLFDADSLSVASLPLLGKLYFGYTQNSLWDLSANSAPFRDTSYRPSLFWQGAVRGENWMPALMRAGIEHESNGKDGVNSRSNNIVFAQPIWRTSFADRRALIFTPKVYGYLEKSDNPDIQNYRGRIDWNFRYGDDEGWLFDAQLRHGSAGHGSALLALSYPLRQMLSPRTGGFIHFQLFNGYGETLLDYDQSHGTQARVGFSIVR
jgi:phospholipase A1/A2